MMNLARLLIVGALSAAFVLFGQTDYRFSENGVSRAYRLSGDEVYASKGVKVKAGSKALRGWGAADGVIHALDTVAMQKLRQARPAERSGLVPVFYDLSELPSAEKLAKMSASDREARMYPARRLMTSKLLVRMDDSRWGELAGTNPVSKKASLLKGWMLIEYADAFAALDATDKLTAQGGWEFGAVLARQMEKKQVLKREVNDPLYSKQWHLADSEALNIGMKGAWDSVTGKGINMTVVDDGLEVAHEDLSPNAYPLETGYHRNFNEGNNDPSPLKVSESHGVQCAGLAAAAGFNNLGVVGVAPEARLMGLRLIAGPSSDEDSGNALAWQPDGIVTHVSSNSWGPTDDGKAAGRIGALQEAGLQKATSEYRGGLGTVFAVSAGNGRQSGDNSSYDEFSGSRFVIGVCAVNRNGEQSSYSEDGMNVAICALGGEFQPPGVMWTTMNSGDEAFQKKAADFPSTEAPVNYTDAMNGTSAAAPQVSGAVALMLEKNPNLGYRDVKEILIRTANREPLKGSDPFLSNSANIQFSHSFGAGLLNVAAAVEAAGSWTNLGPLVTAEASSDETSDIGEGAVNARSIDLSNAKIRVEHVEIIVNATHPNRGEIGFVVEAPSGMKSIAEARSPDDAANFENFRFTSVRHWGESAAGTWKVAAVDMKGNGVTGTLGKVTIRVYGTAQ